MECDGKADAQSKGRGDGIWTKAALSETKELELSLNVTVRGGAGCPGEYNGGGGSVCRVSEEGFPVTADMEGGGGYEWLWRLGVCDGWRVRDDIP